MQKELNGDENEDPEYIKDKAAAVVNAAISCAQIRVKIRAEDGCPQFTDLMSENAGIKKALCLLDYDGCADHFVLAKLWLERYQPQHEQR